MQTISYPADTKVDREELILKHLPVVDLIARSIYRRLPRETSLDDLISTGILGLIAAIDNFKPGLQIQLKTYAAHRIRGAILDSLRRMDWAGRNNRKHAKLINKTIATLEQRKQAAPEEAEVARELGIGIVEYREWVLDTQGLQLMSLDVNLKQEGQTFLDVMGDSESKWPCRIAERTEITSSISRAMQKMSKVDQTVLTLHFEAELSLREIAKVVNLHESRVSQLKSRAILRLRSHVSKRWPLEGQY